LCHTCADERSVGGVATPRKPTVPRCTAAKVSPCSACVATSPQKGSSGTAPMMPHRSTPAAPPSAVSSGGGMGCAHAPESEVVRR
jgi:hypothetical protein